MREQRNAYKGTPSRPWVRVVLLTATEERREIQALADTGNPCAIIVPLNILAEFNLGLVPGMNTNFGPLDGGWLRIQIPEIEVDEVMISYGSDAVAEAAAASHSDFEALVGLPLLKLMEYGGNADSFWVRK